MAEGSKGYIFPLCRKFQYVSAEDVGKLFPGEKKSSKTSPVNMQSI